MVSLERKKRECDDLDHEPWCVKFSVSSICQCLVVQHNLLSWFERWHPCIRTAGTSERITKVTLSQTNMKVTICLRCSQVSLLMIYSHFHRQIWACWSSVLVGFPAPVPQQGHMCYKQTTYCVMWCLHAAVFFLWWKIIFGDLTSSCKPSSWQLRLHKWVL